MFRIWGLGFRVQGYGVFRVAGFFFSVAGWKAFEHVGCQVLEGSRLRALWGSSVPSPARDGLYVYMNPKP